MGPRYPRWLRQHLCLLYLDPCAHSISYPNHGSSQQHLGMD